MATVHGHYGNLDLHPAIATVGMADLGQALRRGLDDFQAMPTHLMFLGMIYPLFGIVAGTLAFSNDAAQLLFPLVSGFAIVGPAAAVGLYELSRRREQGLDTSVFHAFDVLQSPGITSIIAVALVLTSLLFLWLATAHAIYRWIYGAVAIQSYVDFIADVLTTRRGMMLILIGNLVGALYALVAFSISVIAFPAIMDRNMRAVDAMALSFRAVRANPVPMAVWALIVAALLALGSLPLLVGLAVVVPILGHATWHLYRLLIPQRMVGLSGGRS